MQETYKSITDLLRFVYAILNREGSHAPLEGSPGAAKMMKLMQRLEQHESGLNLKRKYFEQQQQQLQQQQQQHQQQSNSHGSTFPGET